MADLIPRTSEGKFAALAETSIRDAEAAQLHAKKWTYKRIGDHFGVTAPAAHQMVRRALDAAGKESRDEALAYMLNQVDMRESVLLELAARTHLVVSHGKVIELNGAPLEDAGPVVQIMAELRQCADQRAKILGLYAPTRSQVTVTDEMTERIKSLAEQLGINDPDVAAIPS